MKRKQELSTKHRMIVYLAIHVLQQECEEFQKPLSIGEFAVALGVSRATAKSRMALLIGEGMVTEYKTRRGDVTCRRYMPKEFRLSDDYQTESE